MGQYKIGVEVNWAFNYLKVYFYTSYVFLVDFHQLWQRFNNGIESHDKSSQFKWKNQNDLKTLQIEHD
jgi:hypothetical protein